MNRFVRARFVVSATLTAVLWTLLTAASVLAGDSTGPFPK